MYSSMRLCGVFVYVRGSISLCYEMNCVWSFIMGYSMPVRGKFSILRLGRAGVALPLRFPPPPCYDLCMLKGTELFLWLAVYY